MRAIDLTGTRVGRWLVVRRLANSERGGTQWLCRCDCGTEREVGGIRLRDASSQSCGCLRADVSSSGNFKHGHSPSGRQPSPTYQSWVGMTQRCGNPNHKNFSDYGGRGISVCERWSKFADFLADMGERPPGMSIERVNNDGDYEPGNCKWASVEEQALNKRSSRIIEFNGRRMTLGEWANDLDISHGALAERIDSWPLEKALTVAKALVANQRLMTIGGETLSVGEWAKRGGVSVSNLCNRLRRGWSPERAVNTPSRVT